MEQEGKPVQPEEVPAAEKQQSETQEKKKPKQPKQPKPSQKPKEKKDVAVVGGKKQGAEIIGITVTKDANFSQWYQELVTKAEMVEYYNEVRANHLPMRPVLRYLASFSLLTMHVSVQISGFYILRREMIPLPILSPALRPTNTSK